MFFLIRTAFWLGLVILVLPIGTGSENSSKEVGVSTFEALAAAQSTMNDLSGFCQRNPQTCVTGGVALQAFGEKAKESARLVYEYIDDAVAPTSSQNHSNTLSEQDRNIPWQGPTGDEAELNTSLQQPTVALPKSEKFDVLLPQPKPANRV